MESSSGPSILMESSSGPSILMESSSGPSYLEMFKKPFGIPQRILNIAK